MIKDRIAMQKNKIFICLISVCIIQSAISIESAQAKLRNLNVGDKMPVFTLPKLAGGEFSYPSDPNEVLVVAFVSAGQKHSEQACIDLQEVVSGFRTQPLELVAVTIEADNKEYYQSCQKEQRLTFPILLDSKYYLWGQLGVIATPTIIVVDKERAISWIKAGYGYDFAPTLRAHLAQTLGLGDEELVKLSSQVETLTPASVTSRMNRHLKMAKMLANKGRLESAITELRKAQELIPVSVEITLELGQLLCRRSRSKEALELIANIKTEKNIELAKVKMISGWAYRQMGDLTEAKKLLDESLQLNPISARTLFELGKIYHAHKEHEKAMQTYCRALAITFKEPVFPPVSQE